MLTADQPILVAKRDRLGKMLNAVIAGVLVASRAGVWIWMGLR